MHSKWPPRTDAVAWQSIVDSAEGALLLDSARQYGLVTGGSKVNIERAEEALRVGASYGYRPAADAAERFTIALLAETIALLAEAQRSE